MKKKTRTPAQLAGDAKRRHTMARKRKQRTKAAATLGMTGTHIEAEKLFKASRRTARRKGAEKALKKLQQWAAATPAEAAQSEELTVSLSDHKYEVKQARQSAFLDGHAAALGQVVMHLSRHLDPASAREAIHTLTSVVTGLLPDNYK